MTGLLNLCESVVLLSEQLCTWLFINYLYCKVWHIVFYLQLVWLNVSAPVRVVPPPGLQEKSHVVRAAIGKHVRDSDMSKYTLDFTIGKSPVYMICISLLQDCNKEKWQRYNGVIWHCVNIVCQSSYQRWIPKPLQHSLPFSCRKPCSIHNVWLSENRFRAARTSHHHRKPSSTQGRVHRVCVCARPRYLKSRQTKIHSRFSIIILTNATEEDERLLIKKRGSNMLSRKSAQRLFHHYYLKLKFMFGLLITATVNH